MHIGGYAAGWCILGDMQQDGVYWGICSRTVYIGGYVAGRCILRDMQQDGVYWGICSRTVYIGVAFRLFVVVSSHQWTLRLGPRPRPTEDLTNEL